MKRILIIILCSLVGLILLIVTGFFLWRKYVEEYDKALIKQGNELVKKIETYKKDHHRLPDSLQQVGVKITKDYPLDYSVEEDSVDYIIAFPISSFHSETYRSSRGGWRIN